MTALSTIPLHLAGLTFVQVKRTDTLVVWEATDAAGREFELSKQWAPSGRWDWGVFDVAGDDWAHDETGYDTRRDAIEEFTRWLAKHPAAPAADDLPASIAKGLGFLYR